MTGSSVFDYVHPSDQQELAEQLGLNGSHHYSSAATAPRPASPAAGAAPDDDTSQGSTPPPRPGSPATSERGQSVTVCTLAAVSCHVDVQAMGARRNFSTGGQNLVD